MGCISQGMEAEIRLQNRKAREAKAEAKVKREEIKPFDLHALAIDVGGYYSRSLKDALFLAGRLKAAKTEYKLSGKGLIAALVESCPTVNTTDIRDVMAIGRCVSVARNHKGDDGRPIDLVASQASLTACRAIGRKLEAMEKDKDTENLRKAFLAASKGQDVTPFLPKRTVKTSDGQAKKALAYVLEHMAEYDELALTALVAALEMVAANKSSDMADKLLKALTKKVA